MARDLLTTRQAARLLAVGTSTLKRWADDGRLESFRTAGGHRRFPREAVEAYLRRQTPALRPVRDEAGGVAHWLELLSGEEDYLEVAGELLGARARRGSWWGVAEELGPVLDELGRRWESGELSVLEEHVASAKLQRALVFCAHSMPTAQTAPTALLTTSYGDDHTLGLSLVELCCREAGWNTRWTGRRTPVPDLVRTLAEQQVGLLVVSASGFSRDEQDLRRQYLQLATACQAAGVPLVVGGRGAWPEQMPHGRRIDDFATFHGYLEELLKELTAPRAQAT